MKPTQETAKHTPGPWGFDGIKLSNVVEDTDIKEYVIYGNNEEDLDEIAIVPITDYEEKDNANARLIAAAPELLECLKEAIEYHTDGGDQTKWMQVVAKAEGRAK